MTGFARTLEDTLTKKLIDIGNIDEEEAADLAFSVVSDLEEEGFFDDLSYTDDD